MELLNYDRAPMSERSADAVSRQEKAVHVVPTGMKRGMRKLLDLHTDVELKQLCSDLELPWNQRIESKLQAIERVFELELVIKSDYRRVLDLIWEGVVVEYLRLSRKKMRSYKEDPRRCLMEWWTDGDSEQTEGFARSYLPVTLSAQVLGMTDEPGITAALTDLLALEKKTKAFEKEVFVDGKNRVSDLFDAVARLRLSEAALRHTMLMETNRARAEALDLRTKLTERNADHTAMREAYESSQLQIVELEDLVGYWGRSISGGAVAELAAGRELLAEVQAELQATSAERDWMASARARVIVERNDAVATCGRARRAEEGARMRLEEARQRHGQQAQQWDEMAAKARRCDAAEAELAAMREWLGRDELLARRQAERWGGELERMSMKCAELETRYAPKRKTAKKKKGKKGASKPGSAAGKKKKGASKKKGGKPGTPSTMPGTPGSKPGTPVGRRSGTPKKKPGSARKGTPKKKGKR
jgi:hypothetical protein